MPADQRRLVLIAALIAVMITTVGCGGGGTNRVPSISNISPSTATRGGSAFTLSVNGSNFISGSSVQWNGSVRQTTFVSAQQVTAQISADDISVAGNENVTVMNPGPGGGTSNSQVFNIPCVLAPPTAASSQTLARLGAYYFDGWTGSYTTYHLMPLVSNPAYQNREPLSGWRDDNTCAIEQQLAWAHSFGLQFFVFDWSPTSPSGENVNSALQITHSLPDRHGMQYAIMGGEAGPTNWTAAVDEWISYMTDPAYLTVNGKPLFVVLDPMGLRHTFGSSSAAAAALNQLRAAAQTTGLTGVYIVGASGLNDGAPAQDGLFPDLSMLVADGYDAVSSYNYPNGAPLGISGARPLSILASTGGWMWSQAALKSPLPMIPVAMDGWDTGPDAAGGDWPGRPQFWFVRNPPVLATFVNNLITLAESNPQVRAEAPPAPPLVMIEAWNELYEGSFMVPNVGDGTSYGDALVGMLTTPATRIRSVLTLVDSGPSDPDRAASGHLVDASGAPIEGASITLSDVPANGSYAQYQLSGQPPAAAATASVGLRVNTDNGSILFPGFGLAGPGATNFSLYQVSYVQPADGIERVPNGDFSAGAQSWSLQGQTQIVPSDRGPGQMVQVVATSAQFATLDSARFPVTAGAPFQLSFSARVVPSNSGYFIVDFQDPSGNFLTIPAPSGGAVHVESIPITAAKVPLASATTDSAGNFQLSLTSLATSQVTLDATYAGDAQHWPAYAQTGP